MSWGRRAEEDRRVLETNPHDTGTAAWHEFEYALVRRAIYDLVDQLGALVRWQRRIVYAAAAAIAAVLGLEVPTALSDVVG